MCLCDRRCVLFVTFEKLIFFFIIVHTLMLIDSLKLSFLYVIEILFVVHRFPIVRLKIKYQVETEQNHHNPSRYFNIVVNGIYDILQRLALLAEVIMVTRENYWPAASRWQTISHKVAKQHSKDGNRTKKRSWGEATTADVDRKGNNIQPQIQINNSHSCSKNSLTFRKTWFHPCVVVGFVLLKL